VSEVRLHLGDCLEVMRGMPDKSVDAIITDPPYGVNYRENAWDASIPDWLAQARRASNLVVFTTAPTTIYEYPPADWICIWHRRAATSRAPSGGFNHWSPILVYGQAKFDIDYYETLSCKTVNQNMGINHPSPKPLELYKWIVHQTTRPGQTILDPFMGSGTTGVACVQTGRNFIGIEIDPKYYAIAERRIRAAQAQPTLWEAAK
jgi:site-specific DNA-methyltransferase (adenine-specific)